MASKTLRLGASAMALALAATLLSGGAGAQSPVAAPTAPSVTMVTPPERDPADLEVLFWSDAQRSARFRAMEDWFAGHEVSAASQPRALPSGEPLSAELQGELRELMQASNAAGVMVVQDGKVRFEEYSLGLGPEDRWTSFSVAKSFTSTLLGAAVRGGFITSLDDPVTRYIPQLAGSAYEGVTVRQLATMTSGVKWNEDYTDPNSDVARTQSFVIEHGPDAIVAQMRSLPREAEPGTKWVYKTGETNLIGVLVENAAGKPLAEFAAEKIVEPAGFAGPMFWMVDPRGGNIGGCCLSLRLSDYARMGLFALEGGKDTVPERWFSEAGRSQVDLGTAATGFGYGYQWWAYPGGAYGAQGIFGQAITLVPDRNLVVAVVSNWPAASSAALRDRTRSVVAQIASE
jgi:CubicO group peptidase (beta-lactamase class C family)